MRNKRIRIIGVVLCILIALGIYGWPRPVDETFKMVLVDRDSEQVTQMTTAHIKGSTYHRWVKPDTFSGILTIEGKEYFMVTTLSERLPSWDDLKRKWTGNGLEVTLMRNSTQLAHAVVSKDFKAISGFFDNQASENIMFAGPASTFEEAKALIDGLFYYEYEKELSQMK